MGNAQMKVVTSTAADIPMQDASLDIWDKKYCLKDKSGNNLDSGLDGTYQRIAKALSEVEAPELREHWQERFLWALRSGAIPAGRIVSNAGAQAHKPATSTINCTVSGTIEDSMDGILTKVHEAGLTLKAGCGIGYEFSTLRPRGAFVSGAGAHTSGPLSFMDIYDRMCFTVSSAGGRRGAQMGTFDVGHPDVFEFIRAKREDGRLRQFNLSLLVTQGFIEAVKADGDWQLAFPINKKELGKGSIEDFAADNEMIWRHWPHSEGYVTNEAGEAACRVYKTVPARRLWDSIMASTYDYAEPGFVLIDKVNEMNNNWWCEDIRATNPCVTADTWVHTAHGPRQVSQLMGQAFLARIDGFDYFTGDRGFFKTATKDVFKLETNEGQSLRLTADHQVRKVTGIEHGGLRCEWVEAQDLKPGDKVRLHDHRAHSEWHGKHNFEQGLLLGLLSGAGEVVNNHIRFGSCALPQTAGGHSIAHAGPALDLVDVVRRAAEHEGMLPPSAGNQFAAVELPLNYGVMGELYQHNSTTGQWQATIPESDSSDCYRGYLRGLFSTRAFIQQGSKPKLTLRYDEAETLQAIQRMLLRLGVNSRIKAANSELVVSDQNLSHFMQVVGLADEQMTELLRHQIQLNPGRSERFMAVVKSLTADGHEDVYDVQVPGVNCFDANGIHAHNCGEQPLPPYGSCLLGSVNLTRFVRDPFTAEARFDWDEYRDVVSVFTRMLDNVVEINGLPLPEQRHEIEHKRRHGMGFLGLGSTATMLGMKYGDDQSVKFTDDIARELAVTGWQTGLELAKEKGPAPIMLTDFTVTTEMLAARPEMAKDGLKVGDKIAGKTLHARYSRYMQRIAEAAPELVDELAEVGARFTHHSSIAPTGTISLSLANNASNGIEPSFAHHYSRNVIREGKKSKEKVDVYSYELLAYRELINPKAMPYSTAADEALPDYFITADDIKPKQHVDIQAAAQKWVDSSISKTANVPTDYPYEDFKDIYLYAYDQGLKGCTTFRFNPEAFQGVLVKEADLENTTYRFELEDGSIVEVKGNEEIEYDGETHSAANLFDALKEGYYGKF